MNTDTPQKETGWLGNSTVVDSAQRGHRKRPRQGNSSNSSIIHCAPSNTATAIAGIDFGGNEQKPSARREDGRRSRNFQKRSRHKMRERAAALKQPPLTKQKDKKERSSIDARKRKKDTSEAIIPKNRSDILAERFISENVANPRITVSLSASHCFAGPANRMSSCGLPIEWGFSKKDAKPFIWDVSL